MRTTSISTDKMRACIRYCNAAMRRQRLYRDIYSGTRTANDRYELADLLEEAMSIGVTTGIYTMECSVFTS